MRFFFFFFFFFIPCAAFFYILKKKPLGLFPPSTITYTSYLTAMTTLQKSKWWKIQWFSEDDTPEERKFILKLDTILVPYLLLTYWVKNLDQNNLSMYLLLRRDANSIVFSPLSCSAGPGRGTDVTWEREDTTDISRCVKTTLTSPV